MKLIDKDAVVAEIKRFKENANKRGAIGKVSTIVLCNEFLSLLNTFEVKEIDLEKEIADIYEANYEEYLTYEEFADVAKHFYELGFKAQRGENI